MPYEVEQKFRLEDRPRIEAALAALGVRWRDPQRQVDTYYAHPSRDFAHSDEALRIRRIEFPGLESQGLVTYKGPKVGQLAKTRKEIELPIAEGAHGAGRFAELLEALGFRSVADVPKVRRPGELDWNGRLVHVALDEVASIGCFLEIELLAEDDDRAAAEQHLQSLSAELRLSSQEMRSYLSLILALPREGA